MTENKRYKVAIYDEKAISGYCVLDLEKPSQTARLKYNNVFIGTKEGCDIVCDLLNEQEETIQRLKEIREEQIQTILKQKRKIKELEEDNNWMIEMTVKINRYEIIDDIYLPGESTGKAIYDFLTHQIIISVRTNNTELNQIFAEMLLKELNTGNYEEYLTGDDKQSD